MIFIANWKMNKPFNDEVAFGTTYKTELIALASRPNTHIIICPSFLSLATLTTLFKNTPIAIGGQTCSPYEQGAYTGQVNAASLKQAGASYCIVGHSEQRTHHGITDELIAQQITNLFAQNIIPIICIGERDDHNRIATLITQLTPLLPIIRATQKPFMIAYEPIWAIGTGRQPDIAILNQSMQFIKEEIDKKIDNPTLYKLLYGGSVDEAFAHELRTDSMMINGLLVGNASLDFQKFKKIVL